MLYHATMFGQRPRKAVMQNSQPAATTSELQAIVDDVVSAYDLRSAFAPTVMYVGRPDDDDEEEDDEDDKGEDKGGEGTGTDASGEGADDEGSDIKDPDKKRLHDEAAKYRNERNALKTERDALAKQVRETEDKDKSKLEKAERDLKEATDRIKLVEAELAEQKRDNAFFKSGVSARFKDPADALRFLDLDEIKPDDEGKFPVKEIKKAAEDLLREKPYLARDEDDDDSGSDEEDSERPSGRSTKGKKKSKGEADRAVLEKKFPALQGRG